VALENPADPNQLTYLLFDLMSQDGNGNPLLLAEVPFQNVSFSQLLNSAGSFTGSLNFLDPSLKKLGLGKIIQPGRTALFVDYQGVLLWGGIIWTVNFARSTADAVQIQAKEFWSYFAQRLQAVGYGNPNPSGGHPSWTSTAGGAGDPMQIAKTIVQDAIGVGASTPLTMGASAFGPNGFQNGVWGAHGPFPLTITKNGTTPTADYVVVSYPITQAQTVDSLVANLSQLGFPIGFDYAIDCQYNANGYPMLTLNLSYPRRGRLYDQNAVTIVTTAAHDYSYPQDSTQQAINIVATGSGVGQMQASLSNPAPTADGWPLLEKVNSYSNVSTQNQLNALVKGDLQIQSWPVTTPTLTIPIFGDPAPYEYLIGDDIRWIIEPDERFPNGIDSAWRIVQLNYAVADAGISTVSMVLNMPPTDGLGVFPPT
jgi:hypothetical protein